MSEEHDPGGGVSIEGVLIPSGAAATLLGGLLLPQSRELLALQAALDTVRWAPSARQDLR